MADRRIVSARDASSNAAIIVLGILVVALVLFGLWYASRHTSISTPQIPNTGAPGVQINSTPDTSGGTAAPSPSPSGR